MTLSIAWVRKIGDTEELVFASDSRLRSGKAWDGCSKIFPMARGDCALSFAGDTQYAYPMINQAINAVEMYPRARSRAMDIADVRGHLTRVFNDMRHWTHDYPRGSGAEIPEISLIFAVYSWKSRGFKIWTIVYKKSDDAFTFHTAPPYMKNRIVFIGDAISEFKKRLYALYSSKNKPEGDGFDYEPFEVLRDMIRENIDPSIGGPPALLKVYSHMNCMPYSLLWPDRKSGSGTILGRPLLDYEVASYPLFDPDVLSVVEAVPKVL